MEWSNKQLRAIIGGIMSCIILYWFLNDMDRVRNFLNWGMELVKPFLVGGCIAFILNVPMRSIERLLAGVKKPGLRRGVAVLLTLLAVVLVLTGVVYLLVPQIAETAEQLVAALPAFFERIYNWTIAFMADNPELATWLRENTEFGSINWSEWLQKILSLLGGSLSSLADRVLMAVVSLSSGVFNAILSLVFAIYCLTRKEILARQGRRILYSILPEKTSDETVRILRMTNATFARFISGQCLEAVILGFMFAVSMSIFKMPYVPLISVIIAVSALVPIVGAFVGCVLGAFFILVQDPMLAVWFVIMFLVLQQIEGNLIYPKVVGSSIGLPGMWVLVAVAVGGELMGISGMLLMIPLTSVLYTLAREFTNSRLEARGIDRSKLNDQPQEIISKRQEKRKAKQAKAVEKLQESGENAD